MTKEIYLQIDMQELGVLKFGNSYTYITEKALEKLREEVPELEKYVVKVKKYQTKEEPNMKLNVKVTFELEKNE